MSIYKECLKNLRANPKKWLVTGVAGFIGSHLAQTLLENGQHVRGLDNFSTGYQKNLDIVAKSVGHDAWSRFSFIRGDIREQATCKKATEGINHILHEAALGSVVSSVEDPISSNQSNVDGFLHMLVAARDAGATFVYAASSSTYGDEPSLPKVESKIGTPLSPYAVTKYINELYASVFEKTYNFKSIGLRYFNIFGERQDPYGAYAAVIPQWFSDIIKGKDVYINGDGETSRDFCYIKNCVQANILASCSSNPEAWNKVYNIAVGHGTSLNELFQYILNEVKKYYPNIGIKNPIYREFRIGDVRHSLGDISLAKKYLGYEPQYTLKDGLKEATEWYVKHLQ